MPRGGERSGRPGAQYANRNDLQNSPRTAGTPSDKGYGQGVRQAAVRSTPTLDAQTAAPQGPAIPAPGELTSLEAPTARPDEPVTAGLDIGPGPGSEALSGPRVRFDDALMDLRAFAQQFPEYRRNFARLIAIAEDQV